MRKTRIKNRRRFASKKLSLFLCLLLCIAAACGVIFFPKSKKDISYPIPKSLLIKTAASKSVGGETDIKKTEQIRLIEEHLTRENIQFSTIQIASSSALLVVLKDGGKIFFSRNKDIASQISSLQLILSRFTIEGKRFGTLDFRFDRPVVSLERS